MSEADRILLAAPVSAATLDQGCVRLPYRGSGDPVARYARPENLASVHKLSLTADGAPAQPDQQLAAVQGQDVNCAGYQSARRRRESDSPRQPPTEIPVTSAAVVPSHWPLSYVMPPLGAIPAAPGCVRAHVGTVLAAWRLQHLIEDGELIASELAANAVNASRDEAAQLAYASGRAPVIQVCLFCDWTTLRLEVWDQAPGTPVLCHPANFEEAGRGLALVEALSQRWGWQPAPAPARKIVWAELHPRQ